MASQSCSLPDEGSTRRTGLQRLLDSRLPLNRKEAYFTATVLPAIICADNFKYFDRFLDLLGVGDTPTDVCADNANIQFFTEYSLAEAIYDDVSKDRLPRAPRSKERPDVLIFIEAPEPVLIVVEAKLYSNFQAFDLNKQMKDQNEHIVAYLQTRWPGLRTVHAALLPRKMKEGLGNSGPRLIVTWEEILDKYKDVESARYFHEILDIALRNYEILKADTTPSNGDDELAGEEIWRNSQNGTLKFQTMGRQGGLHGDALQDDIATGGWKEQHYFVRASPDPHNANWFHISEFVDLVSRKSTTVLFDQILESARDSEIADAALGRLVRQLVAKRNGGDLLAA